MSREVTVVSVETVEQLILEVFILQQRFQLEDSTGVSVQTDRGCEPRRGDSGRRSCMGLKAGPYKTAKEARTALVEAGYRDLIQTGIRPRKWIHPDKSYEFAIRILNSGRAKIVKYPDLRRLEYQTTSDAERQGQGLRLDLKRSIRKRPRA